MSKSGKCNLIILTYLKIKSNMILINLVIKKYVFGPECPEFDPIILTLDNKDIQLVYPSNLSKVKIDFLSISFVN
jgi:hypothetical protein